MLPSARAAFLAFLLATFFAGAARAETPGGQTPPAEAGPAVETPPPPVEWLPFTPQVFERARKEARGVLLTIVSSWCRPCLAADEQVYSDPVVRQILAKRWLPVRVDRDDRPDIDSRYQLAATSFTKGKTGLPITAFLFATGEAMWADTYIPLEDRETRPGLRTLLVSMDQLWRTRFPEAQKNAQFIQMTFDFEKNPVRQVAPSPEFLSALTGATIAKADYQHGGFGEPPRVTNPYNAELALLASWRRRDDGLKERALAALRGALGGAGYDRIGGGFHRVARDESWSVAIWDKPLSVNATYLESLVEAARATKDPELIAAASKTADYILGTLRAPGGGFYLGQAPSQDPDDDAATYTWKVEEVKTALSEEEQKWARALFGLRDEGELLLGLPPRFTLKNAMTLDEAARGAGRSAADIGAISARILAALGRARSTHPAPPVMEARYLDSTALAASALLQAGAFLGRSDAIRSALDAIDAILKESPSLEKGVRHRLDGDGSSSPVMMADQVYLGSALLDAYEIAGEQRYLDASLKSAASLRNLFLDQEGGGFFDVVADPNAPGYLRLRRKLIIDGISPSPATSAARWMLRLATLTGDTSLRDMAAGSIAWTATHLPAIDPKCSTLGLALDALLQPPVRITIGGGGEAASGLLGSAWRLYEPGRILERKANDKASMSVCVGDRCRKDLQDPVDLEAVIAEMRAKAAGAPGSVAAP